MKNIILLLSLLLLVCSFQTKTNTDTTPLIKKTINLKTGNSTEYYYGKNGKIDREINSSGTQTNYSYSSVMVVKILKPSASSTISTSIDTFILNDKGLAKSNIFYQNNIRFRTESEYDEQDHIVRSYSPADAHNLRRELNSYTYTNGNRTKTIFWDDNKKPLQTQTATYLPKRKNTIGNENYGRSFLGKSSLNLIKQDHSLNYDSDSFSISYSYKFDEKDRVRLKVSYNPKGILIDSISYSYY